jgi:hypothetical protein
MNNIKLTSIIKENFLLPLEFETRVNNFWQDQIAQNPKLFNGEVYGVEKIERVNEQVSFILIKSNFAHYLYTQKIGDLGQYNLINIFCSVIIKTKDDYFVFGKMNNHTSMPGQIQFCGGGIDNEDIIDNQVNFTNCISRELTEEMFLSGLTPELYSVYQIPERNKVAVIFYLNLSLSKYEIENNFFKNKNSNSEFQELIFTKNNKNAISEFLTTPNLEIIVRKIFQS